MTSGVSSNITGTGAPVMSVENAAAYHAFFIHIFIVSDTVNLIDALCDRSVIVAACSIKIAATYFCYSFFESVGVSVAKPVGNPVRGFIRCPHVDQNTDCANSPAIV